MSLNTYLADVRTPSRLLPVVVAVVALPPRGGVLDDVAEDRADLLGAEVARGELGPDDGAAQVLLEAGEGLIDGLEDHFIAQKIEIQSRAILK